MNEFGEMKNPLPHRLKDPVFKKLYEDSKKSGFHINSVDRDVKEWKHLPKDEQQIRLWYHPICSVDEVNRICNPQNISDYLLFQRAEFIIGNMRPLRTFHNKAELVKEKDWSLTEMFDDRVFNLFLTIVSQENQKEFRKHHFGTLFSSDPNAWCEITPYGTLVCISDTLKKFIYFMSLGFYSIWENKAFKIPDSIYGQAQAIGVRTMLGTEALDFDIDPRGKVPNVLHASLENITTSILIFILGHEYGHILLNHLSYLKLTKISFAFQPSTDKGVRYSYMKSQNEELQADIKGVEILAEKNPEDTGTFIYYGVLFFCYLEIYEPIFRQYHAIQNPNEGSHPAPIDRINNLIQWGDKILSETEKINIERHINYTEKIKSWMMEHYDFNTNVFEAYGSVYLEQWRKKSLRIELITEKVRLRAG